MSKKTTPAHTIEQLEELFASIQEKFQWLGGYL